MIGTVSAAASKMRRKISLLLSIIEDQIAELEQSRIANLDESAKLKHEIEQLDKFHEWKNKYIDSSLNLLLDYGKEDIEENEIQENEGRIQQCRDRNYAIEEQCAVITADIERLLLFQEIVAKFFGKHVREQVDQQQHGDVLSWSEVERAQELFRINEKPTSTLNHFLDSTNALLRDICREIKKFEEEKSDVAAYTQRLGQFLEGTKKNYFNFLTAKNLK